MHLVNYCWFAGWVTVSRHYNNGKIFNRLTHIQVSGPVSGDIQPFFQERIVEVRPVSWRKHFSELLQIYRTKLEQPVPVYSYTSGISSSELAHSLEEAWRRNQTVLELVHAARKYLGAKTRVSHSTHLGLEKWMYYQPREKLRLCSKLLAEHRAQKPLDPQKHLKILYIDKHICVVVKPSGVLSVPGIQRNPSILNLLYEHLFPSELETMDQMAVHRLDMDTSGILVFALSKQASSQLHFDFRQRNVYKEYEALVSGWIDTPEFDIQLDLERDPHHLPFMRIAQPRTLSAQQMLIPFLNASPKHSWTEMRVLQRTASPAPVTRVQLIPHTGRTHQLRVHTAALGFPILGDCIYGYRRDAEGNAGGKVPTRQQLASYEIADRPSLCLHARRLAFRHPISQEPMLFVCDAPF